MTPTSPPGITPWKFWPPASIIGTVCTGAAVDRVLDHRVVVADHVPGGVVVDPRAQRRRVGRAGLAGGLLGEDARGVGVGDLRDVDPERVGRLVVVGDHHVVVAVVVDVDRVGPEAGLALARELGAGHVGEAEARGPVVLVEPVLAGEVGDEQVEVAVVVVVEPVALVVVRARAGERSSRRRSARCRRWA